MPCLLFARLNSIFLKRARAQKAEDKVANGFELLAIWYSPPVQHRRPTADMIAYFGGYIFLCFPPHVPVRAQRFRSERAFSKHLINPFLRNRHQILIGQAEEKAEWRVSALRTYWNFDHEGLVRGR